MRHVALLQNESEMRHLVYGDASRTLEDLGFTCALITAETVAELARRLETDGFDALVVGSNALNDETICATLFGATFSAALAAFLERGGGFVCFHQMALARRATALAFLPSPWDRVVPRLPAGEADGVSSTLAGGRHPALHFPEVVDTKALHADSRTATSLGRLWFHYWDTGDGAWAPLLIGNADLRRVLVAVALDPRDDRRMVLCAPPADWQRSPTLLPNLVHFACHGARPPALIGPVGDDRHELRVITEWLSSDRIHLERYPPDTTEALIRRLDAGIHETVLLAPEVVLDPEVRKAVERRVASGELRLLEYGGKIEGRHPLTIASARLSVADVQRPLEALAVAALDDGYIDGSFSRTVESIRVLDALTTGPLDRALVARAITEAVSHQQDDGSYDTTLAATCGLLYLLDRFKHPGAARAATFLRECNVPTTEALAAFTALAETSDPRDEDRERLRTLLDGLGDLGELTDGELLTALHAAQAAQHGLVEKLATALLGRRDEEGHWRDLETTAIAVERFVALREQLVAREDAKAAVADVNVNAVLADAAVAIRHAARLDRERPWANRISTSLMCLRAIALVNATLDVPVSETIDALQRGTRTSELRSAGEAAALAAASLRTANDALRAERDQAVTDRDKARKSAENVPSLRRWRIGLATAVAALGWVVLQLFVAAADDTHWGTVDDLFDAFLESQEAHLGAFAIIAAVTLGLLLRERGQGN